MIRLPFDVAKLWGKRGHLRVKCSINGFAFRGSLFPDGKGHHFLVINKKIQKGSRTAAGMRARFEMEPDTEPRTFAVPPELSKALNEEPPVRKYFDRLNDSTRRAIARWIAEAKQPATRARRADEMAERLMQVMEAERELPPVLLLALMRNPKAREGWELMPPSHKRDHLFSIFHYKHPDSRGRRIERAIEMMMEYAEKASRKD
jgi:uncharacterized protein YdeI (YjbR/CyaY-like superfamily)